MRKIYLIGEVNETMSENFSTQLDLLLEKSLSKPVHIELSSEGGTVLDALAIVGKITTSPCPCYITAHGKVMSAAVLILASGDYRLASPQTWIMHHEDELKVRGSTSELQRMAVRAEQEEEEWSKWLARYTRKSSEFWRNEAKLTKYWTADEALELGLIDEVLKGKK